MAQSSIMRFDFGLPRYDEPEETPAVVGLGTRGRDLIEPGNIDVNTRKVLNNPDGSISTESSISIGTDRGEVLIPTVVDGKRLSEKEAVEHFKRTGEHLGVFRTPQAASAYAESLHERQGQAYSASRGVDPDVLKIRGIESGGNATAKNPRSSATGADQFIESTWLDMVQKYRPDLMQGRTRKQVLDLRKDDDLSLEMSGHYTQENVAALRKQGLPVLPETKYLSHFLGAGGAASVLRARPGTSLSELLPANVIKANPHLKGKSNTWVINWAKRKMSGEAAAPAEEATVSPVRQRFQDLEAKEPGRYKVIKKADYENWRKEWDESQPGAFGTAWQGVKEWHKGLLRGAAKVGGGTALQGIAGFETILDQKSHETLAKHREQLARLSEMSEPEASAWLEQINKPSSQGGTDILERYFLTQAIQDIRDGKLTPEQIAALPEPKATRDRQLYQKGEEIKQWAERTFGADPAWQDGLTAQLSEGVGSFLGGLPFAAAGPAAGGAFFTTLGVGEATERAVAYQEKMQQAVEKARAEGLPEEEIAALEAKTPDEKQVALSALYGIAPGATDLIPAETLLYSLKVPRAAHKPLLNIIGRIGGQAFIEGIQEGGQQALQNWIAQGVYNPEQEIGEGVAPNTAVGAGVGGIVQTGVEVIKALIPGRQRGAAADQPQPEAAPGAEAAAPPKPAGPLTSALQKGGIEASVSPGQFAQVVQEDGSILPVKVHNISEDGWAQVTDEGGEAYEVLVESLTPLASDPEVVQAGPASLPGPEPRLGLPAPALRMPDETSGPAIAVPETGGQRAARALRDERAGTRQAPVPVETPEDVAAAAAKVDPDPTPGQRDAENYQHGHITFPEGHPLKKRGISIETAKGGTRKAKDGSWEVPDMPVNYGRWKGTKGADGEAIDVSVGDDLTSDRAFIVDQQDPETGKFDEHKTFVGVGSAEEVADLYARSFTDGKGAARIQAITEGSTAELDAWLDEDQTKPAVETFGVQTAPATTPKSPETEIGAGTPAAEPVKTPKPVTADDLEIPAFLDRRKQQKAAEGTEATQASEDIQAEKPSVAHEPAPMQTVEQEMEAARPAFDEFVAGKRRIALLSKDTGIPKGVASRLLDEAVKAGTLVRTKAGGYMRAADVEARKARLEAGQAKKKPVTTMLKALGGIDPDSPLAGDLRAMGITAKNAPGLFKRGGRGAIDNIPASEHELFANDGDARGYIKPDVLKEALAGEVLNNSPRLSREDQEAEESRDSEESHARAREEIEAAMAEADLAGDEAVFDRALSLYAQGLTPEQAVETAMIQLGEEGRDDTDESRYEAAEIPGFGESDARAVDEAVEGVSERRYAAGGGSAGAATPVQAGETPARGGKTQGQAPRQGELEGTEAISDAELAQRRADERLKAKADQQPADQGLFSDDRNQTDLVDLARAPERGVVVPAEDSDEVVTITLTEKGPWDFNDTYPKPDPKKQAALIREGRWDFREDGDGLTEDIAATFDESLNELQVLLSERGALIAQRKVVEADPKAKPPRRGMTGEEWLKQIDEAIGERRQAIRNISGTYSDIFTQPAVRAMLTEARKRVANEGVTSEVTPEMTAQKAAGAIKEPPDPIADKLIEAGLMISYQNTIHDKNPRIKGSRLFAYPLDYERQGEKSRLFLRHPKLAEEDFVKKVAGVSGLTPETDDGSSTSSMGRYGTWHHAVDLATDEDFKTLIKTKEYTTPDLIAGAVQFGVGQKGRLSIENAKALLAAIDAKEPSREETIAAVREHTSPGSTGSGGPAINMNAPQPLGAWATIHGIEDGYFAYGRGKSGFLSFSEKGLELVNDAPAKTEAPTEEKPQRKKAPAREPKAKGKGSSQIEDFGEKIEGARKDIFTGFRESLKDELDVTTAPLSKSFPQPNYEKLADAGVSKRALALIAVMRDTIPNKPRQSWKAKQWAKQVGTLRDFAVKILDGETDLADLEARLKESHLLRDIVLTADAIEDMAPEDLPRAAQYRVSSGSYSMLAGKRYSPQKTFWFIEGPKRRSVRNPFSNDPSLYGTYRDNPEETIALAKKIIGLELANQKADGSTPQRSKYTDVGVYRGRQGEGVFLGFKVRSTVIRLKTGFENVKAARDYLEENRDDLQATIDEMRKGPNERGAENRPRKGASLRSGDVTPEVFSDTFGFRGVQFGNYVEGGRRQEDLNRAFDALMDLADVLDVPPRALSLSGQLGLAFGARGTGGKRAAAAHYEPNQVVINLTKGAGPGSLAHEWLHALDNYFARKDEAPSSYMSERRRDEGPVREEVYQAWKDVEATLKKGSFAERSAKFDEARSKPYFGTTIEKAARAFERYIVDRLDEKGTVNDYLANIDLEGGAYPTADEMQSGGIRAAYDQLFNVIEARETEDGVELASAVPRLDGDAQARIEQQIRARVAKLVGADIPVQLFPVILEQGSAQYRADNAAASAAAGGEASSLGGTTRIWSNGAALIRIATRDPGYDPFAMAVHEPYHAVAALYQTDAERALIAKQMDRIRAFAVEQIVEDRGFPRDQAEQVVAALPAYEAEAIAAERYVRLRDAGTPISKTRLPRAVAVIFEKFRRLIAEIARVLEANGIRRWEDIYEDFYQGRMADRERAERPRKFTEMASGVGRPYANVPDNLMGFRKDGPQKGFDETKYPHAQDVRVTFPGQAPFEDAIKGLNREHALERARRNWNGAEIEAVDSSPAQTDTPAFKAWFGDSKVVDENGKPLVVYHGTDVDFETFERTEDIGFHFGGPDTASKIVLSNSGFGISRGEKAKAAYTMAQQVGHVAEGGRLVPAYLRVENPLKLPDMGTWEPHQVLAILEGRGIITREQADEADIVGREEVRDWLAAKGYDGIVYRNKVEGTDDSWIVFDPEQIKSATGNSGAFDPENPNIAASSISSDSLARDTASDRQEQMGRDFGAAPLDSLIRVPFDIFGGTNEKGEWQPGLKLSEKAADIITKAEFAEGSRFAFMNPILHRGRAGLIDRYGLDPAYVELERQRGLDERRIMSQIPELMRTLKDANIGTEEAKALQAILTGEALADAEWAKISEPIRNAIDQLGQDAVELGLLSAESYERNKGSYLHRVYLKHETDQSGLARMANRIMGSRRRKILGEQFKGRGQWVLMPFQNLKRHIEGLTFPENGERFRIVKVTSQPRDGEPGRARRVFLREGDPVPDGATDLGVYEVRGRRGGAVVLWRDWTKDERMQMGEIVDARYTIAKTYMLMANDLATGKFFRDIAENKDWTWDENTPPPNRWMDAAEYRGKNWADPDVEWVRVPDVTIPKSKTKRYGALAGRFVRAEIWRDLNELDKMQRDNFWSAILKQWKLNKTARSPVVHMNNIMSNFLLMDMAGVGMSDLVQGLRAMLDQDARYQEAVDGGAFGADMISVEMRENVLRPLLDEIEADMVGKADDASARASGLGKLANAIWGAGVKFDRKMRQLYQMEDEVFRMATYMRRRRQGATPQEAALEARDQFLNYDIRAPWINAARRTVLPFLSYIYRAAPIVARTIATRPWKIAKYAALAYGFNALAYAMFPGDEDEERRSMREGEQGYVWIGAPRMLRMPFGDSYGNPVFLDIRRWIPAGDVFDMTQGHSAFNIPAPLLFGGPLMLGAELMLNKQSFTGKEIVNDLTDDWWDKSAKIGDWAWKSWMPSAAWVPGSWYWQKISDAASGVRDWSGRPYDLPQAISSSVGLKLKPQDVREGFRIHGREFEKVERDLKSQMSRLGRDRSRGAISEGAFDRERNRLIGKMQGLTRKAQETFNHQ